MKVVFLDFDGVLNNREWVRLSELETDFAAPNLSLEWWALGLDPSKVRLLNRILDETGAKVVVSSSWRYGSTTRWLQAVLELVGFKGEVIDKTPRFVGCDRSEEIAAWLQRHSREIENFIILDDDADADIPGRFIHTAFEIGLTEEHVERAIGLLGPVSAESKHRIRT